MSSRIHRLTAMVGGLAMAFVLVLSMAAPGAALAAGKPVVTLLSPAVGPAAGGNTVTIVGHGFVKVTKVRFGTKAAVSFKVLASTQITAKAPSGSGAVNVRVTTAAGVSSATSKNKYTYYALATVTAVSPAGGPTSGGTSVTITGTGFTGVTAVKFGALSCVVHRQLGHLDHRRRPGWQRHRGREGDDAGRDQRHLGD